MYAMADFEGKCPRDLLNFLHSKHLTESMTQLHRLVCLTLTIPIPAATVERTFSAIKRIKAYTRNTAGQRRDSALASMAIEKDLLMELKQRNKLSEQEVFSSVAGSAAEGSRCGWSVGTKTRGWTIVQDVLQSFGMLPLTVHSIFHLQGLLGCFNQWLSHLC
uniref:HAT C-terminal dimerisation domain-containing protein n=1 Tax=Iconisemion striatum TaxID=60296 RepID=A0A1A7YB41_9TELE